MTSTRLFYKHDVSRIVAALERIADALTPVASNVGYTGPVSLTIRGIRISVELPRIPQDTDDDFCSEERCVSKTFRASCEGTGHVLCDDCANLRKDENGNG